MGAMLAATTYAPLMAIMMISEMTLSFEVVLPLVLAGVAAYTVARIFRLDSVYAASLRREEEERPPRPLSAFRVAELTKPDHPGITLDTGLDALAEAFSSFRVQYLYVTDADGDYLGAVSLHDLMRRRSTDAAPLTARDLLLTDFPTLAPDMNLSEAVMVFARHRGERLPVVEPAGRLLGSVTKTDVLFLMQGGGAPP